MDMSNLNPDPASRRKRRRVGRGISAGQGKTCGRGHKGDKARGQSKIGFEGGQTPLHRRLPRRRGFTNIFRRQMSEVNVGQLEQFDANTEITPEVLLEKRVIRKLRDGLKVLGDGELTKALTVKANAFSKAAIEKIEAAGGTVEVLGQAAPAAAEKPVETRQKRDDGKSAEEATGKEAQVGDESESESNEDKE